MKTRFFTLILFAACAIAISAQQKKVAVYVTGQESGVNKVLGDQLVSAFSQSGDYIAIERTSAFLQELGKEQKYQRTGAVDDSDISRLGKQFGVNQVCVADISEVFGEKYVSARLIDVESAEIVKSTNASGQMNTMSDLLQMSKSLVAGLIKGTGTQSFPASQDKKYGIENATERGFVQMDNLLVAFTELMEMNYTEATKYAKKCSLGGYADWRLPTKNEISKILKLSAEWHKSNSSFPDFTQQFITGEKGKKDCRYWCQDKDFYENGTFSHGTTAEPTAKSLYIYPSIRTCLVLLVRNYQD